MANESKGDDSGAGAGVSTGGGVGAGAGVSIGTGTGAGAEIEVLAGFGGTGGVGGACAGVSAEGGGAFSTVGVDVMVDAATCELLSWSTSNDAATSCSRRAFFSFDVCV